MLDLNLRGFQFVCHSCGNGFDEPEKVQEDRGEFWGMPAYEEMWYCPCCGSEDFDEIQDSDFEEDEQ